MKNIIFYPIPNYEGLYSISKCGIVKAEARKVPNFGIHSNILKREKIMSIQNNVRGYLSVRLRKDNSTHTVCIHRIIAQIFCANPLNYPQVNHLDGNKLNNCISNLEWCTSGQNQKHAWDTGLRKRFTQEKHPKSKIVLHTLTGVFYNSIKELALLLETNHSTLKGRLNGSIKNKTPYILC